MLVMIFCSDLYNLFSCVLMLHWAPRASLILDILMAQAAKKSRSLGFGGELWEHDIQDMHKRCSAVVYWLSARTPFCKWGCLQCCSLQSFSKPLASLCQLHLAWEQGCREKHCWANWSGQDLASSIPHISQIGAITNLQVKTNLSPTILLLYLHMKIHEYLLNAATVRLLWIAREEAGRAAWRGCEAPITPVFPNPQEQGGWSPIQVFREHLTVPPGRWEMLARGKEKPYGTWCRYMIISEHYLVNQYYLTLIVSVVTPVKPMIEM